MKVYTFITLKIKVLLFIKNNFFNKNVFFLYIEEMTKLS